MGCSSSRPAAKEKNPNLKTGIPKKRPADMENGLDVDGGEANNVKDLILKRSQQSMEGRANQVKFSITVLMCVLARDYGNTHNK